MAGLLFSNNASAALASSITTSSTTITVTTGAGAQFPGITSGNFFYATLTDSSNNLEIVKVTARSSGSDVLTVVRAQEGTTARAYAAADKIELRVTAAGMNSLPQLGQDNTFTGANTFSGSSTFSGTVALNGTTTATTQSSGDNSTNIATTAFVKTVTAAVVSVLTGSITMWGSSTPPSGYLTCNGAAVSRTTYASLYAAYGAGTTYWPFGQGDGSTTFNLPDFSGAMPIGATGATSSSFTGTISGTTLTVTGVGSGTVAINHVLSGVSASSVAATSFVVGTKYQILSTSGTTTTQWIACGASDAPATGQTFVCTATGAGTGTAYPVIAAGTTITGFVSGTLGGNGTYTVNISQTINSMTIAGAKSAIALASTGGAASTSLTPSNLPNHNHTATVSDPGHVHSYYTAFSAVGGAAGSDLRNGYGYYNTGSQVTGITVSNANNGSNAALSTISPYLGIYFIIKT